MFGPFPLYATVIIMQKYVVLEKTVGQTPLECAELWRKSHPEFAGTPLSYAGRLDPMASGKLLVLIGDECKKQEQYHGLDKRYEFSVLLGVSSDTGDVLGRLTIADIIPSITKASLQTAAKHLTSNITLPYPHFSSKTVQGKPLHVWTLEGRLHEITIPTQSSNVYSLRLEKTETKTRAEIYREVSTKIETVTPVTDASKALGNDFRRVDVRADWKEFSETGSPADQLTIATFACTASSGTYMRSLAEEIAKACNTTGLAYHIHRTHIGHFKPLPIVGGFWRKRL
jgi:tRNA pseudouridine(55) synthase